jgi:hypothetical protein
MKLETKNIFLDTSTYEKNNFLVGKKIISLFKHGEEKTIKIYSSLIVINELKDRIRKNVLNSKSLWKKFRNENPDAIFRNSDTFAVFEKLWEIDFNKEINIIYGKIDIIIKTTPVYLIDTKDVNIEKVFDKYFKTEAPFKDGLKKHEFPDAFILESIDAWCDKNGEKMIVVSTDGDWLNYKSGNLIKYNDLDLLLDKISRHKEIEQKEQKIIFVFNEISRNSEKLVKDLSTYFDDSAYFDTGEAEIIEFKVNTVNWAGLVLADFDDEHAKIDTELTVQLSADLSYKNYENGYYNREDDKWYFLETINETIEREIKIPVTISVSFDFDEKTSEIQFEDINNNKPIDLNF